MFSSITNRHQRGFGLVGTLILLVLAVAITALVVSRIDIRNATAQDKDHFKVACAYADLGRIQQGLEVYKMERGDYPNMIVPTAGEMAYTLDMKVRLWNSNAWNFVPWSWEYSFTPASNSAPSTYEVRIACQDSKHTELSATPTGIKVVKK